MNTHNLTFTRFVAALLVVFFHFGLELDAIKGGVRTFFANGNIAVSYFFYLSGFVLYKAYQSQLLQNTFRPSVFLINRFSRIYPLYFLALLFFLIISHLTWQQEIFTSKSLLSALLLQSWFSGEELSLNYPGWSLSNEIFFYICFPSIVGLYQKNNKQISLDHNCCFLEFNPDYHIF